MLSKKMQYWSNQEAVREAQVEDPRYKYDASPSPHKRDGKPQAAFSKQLVTGGRNPRSVMDVPTAPYKGSHYATFPPNLIAPLIRATCPRWACPVCGQGWSPVVEKGYVKAGSGTVGGRNRFDEGDESGFTGKPTMNVSNQVKEYRPTCEHEHTKDEAVPGICLDPFVGSGTTVMVAKQLLRRGVGLDISMEYIDQQAKVRTGEGSPSGALDELPLFALTDNEV
jgi:hypothetical protein